MDQAGLAETEHRAALAGLRRINSISRSARGFLPVVREAAARVSGRRVRVLDLACGGGDVAIALAGLARRDRVECEIHGLDMSDVAVSIARDLAASARLDRVTFSQSDVLQDPLPGGFDIVMCSLFLHHLTEDQTRQLLTKMSRAADRYVQVSDLQRLRLGYLLAWAGCRVLSRSPIVHFDGPVSVEGAYTMDEIRRLATDAGLFDVRVMPAWPARYLLTWRRT